MIRHACNKTQIQILLPKRNSIAQGLAKASLWTPQCSLPTVPCCHLPLELSPAFLLLNVHIPFALSLVSQFPCIFWLLCLALAPCSPLAHGTGHTRSYR